MTRFPIRCVWIATGNNPQFSNEIARRMVRIRLDPHEDQPWLREGFRHPNLLGWVWQNRPRLVAACLTLGQAWIAAGRPRHQKTIGSFEGWAEVMGGILEVADVPGFLGNLKEMYERADAEGGVWRSFVALWWDRFGTQQVSVADLYELALQSGIPLARGDEHAKRTSLGQALRRMRDRIYATGVQRLRVRHAGSAHGVQRWALEIVADQGTGSSDVGGPGGPHPAPESAMPGGPPQRPTGGPPEKTVPNQSAGGPGGPGGPLSPLHVRAHARAIGEPGKGPPTPLGPPSPANPRVSGGGPRGGLQNGGPPGSNGSWEELM